MQSGLIFMEMVARFLPVSRNVMAGQLSCQDQVIGTEWSPYCHVSERIFRVLDRPVMDLNAAQVIKKLPIHLQSCSHGLEGGHISASMGTS